MFTTNSFACYRHLASRLRASDGCRAKNTSLDHLHIYSRPVTRRRSRVPNLRGAPGAKTVTYIWCSWGRDCNAVYATSRSPSLAPLRCARQLAQRCNSDHRLETIILIEASFNYYLHYLVDKQQRHPDSGNKSISQFHCEDTPINSPHYLCSSDHWCRWAMYTQCIPLE